MYVRAYCRRTTWTRLAARDRADIDAPVSLSLGKGALPQSNNPWQASPYPFQAI